MKKSQSPPLDISIITYNSEKWLAGFFESLNTQNYPLHLLNLYITDNGSTDGTIARIEEIERHSQYASFHFFRNENLGFGHAHNNNIKHGASKFVLAANIDLTFESDAIEILTVTAENDSDDSASWEMRQKPYEHPKKYDPVSLETSWSSSACTLFRRSAFEDVGGYDDVFFMYGEDVDLSWRLRAKNFKLKYCPAAVCWHYTYSDSKFKKIQFLGSLLGNLYLRARFGTAEDIVIGEKNYRSVMDGGPSNYPEQKEDLEKNFSIYQKNKAHFLSGEEKDRQSFRSVAHFEGDWDYERIRDGAFTELKKSRPSAPLVSIVVRTYSGRSFLLRDCIQSVLNQTYANFEILVVEDGGSFMESTVASFGDSRIRYFSLPKVGRCATGNHGLEKAQGTFIGFLDDDDLFFADHIETLMDVLTEEDAPKAAYANSYEVKTQLTKDEQGNVLSLVEQGPLKIFDLSFKYSELLVHNLMPIQTVIFHRSLFEEAGGFLVSLDNLEDWNLWTRYSALSRFEYVKKTTSLFRTPADTAAFESRSLEMTKFYQQALEKQEHIFLSGVSAASIRKEFDLYRDEIARLNHDIVHLRQHIDGLSSSYEMTINELRAEYEKLDSVYKRIVNSRAWRLSSIPRSVWRKIRQLIV